eukprot:Gregarina_sp_Poly_1__8767@NODE_525_length_7703_cov_51_704164_g416_i0_p5_GENE_NODE_525_length_7703_cov_51_704164_g416_i0NODE_525_length_7703_cov_51_704164_g416_i0_p5_ORF_typecomplete_len248_score56_16Med21/PF11221_8/2_5e07Rapsyn_N/PF10579_9/0_14_NODE_525_length_7703_cov_51_704164_g416_i052976040
MQQQPNADNAAVQNQEPSGDPVSAMVAEGGLSRTIIPSAPAVDAITQTQIALNNLLDQVRETFLFLLEGAPPLDLNNEFVNQPEDTLKRWKKFRVEFEEEWRSGKSKKKKTGDAANVEQDDEIDTTEIISTGYTVPPITEQAITAVKSDALFRAQRIAAIAQSVRVLITQLPSTKIGDGDVQIDIGDPHTSPVLGAKIEYWKKLNKAVEASFHDHSNAMHRWMRALNGTTRKLSKEIVANPMSQSKS